MTWRTLNSALGVGSIRCAGHHLHRKISGSPGGSDNGSRLVARYAVSTGKELPTCRRSQADQGK
jgi:hypothetical protein